MNYRVNLPYPKPCVEQENLEYAKILSQDYAGTTSEETAIHLYIYQSLILEKSNPAISTILKQIAIVEMEHLELLGQTINCLGLHPKYVTYSPDNIKQFWTSASVNYTTSIQNILKQDIKAETIAIKMYEKHRKEIHDKYVQELLTRIIKDEQIHLNIFKNLYKQQKELERHE